MLLLAAIAVIWFFEIHSLLHLDSIVSRIMRDAMQCLTAAVIFGLFTFTKTVRLLLFQRYSTVNDLAAE